LELVTKTKSTVSVPHAVISQAARRLAAETSISWLDLLNFMRIFRKGAGKSSPENTRFGIERAARAWEHFVRRSATFLKTPSELRNHDSGQSAG